MFKKKLDLVTKLRPLEQPAALSEHKMVYTTDKDTTDHFGVVTVFGRRRDPDTVTRGVPCESSLTSVETNSASPPTRTVDHPLRVPTACPGCHASCRGCRLSVDGGERS